MYGLVNGLEFTKMTVDNARLMNSISSSVI